MNYILEGPDGTGKTWYAKYELSTLGYYHNKVKPKSYRDVIKEAGFELLFLNKNPVSGIVLDRSFIISEYIYSVVLNRTRYITEDFLLEYIRDCYEQRIQIIVFLYRVPDKTSIITLGQKEKDHGLPIRELNNFYTNFFIPKEKRYSNISILYIEDLLKIRGRDEDNCN